MIEFNARFGDPETEVVLPLLQSDIYDVFYAVATGAEPQPLRWSDDVTLGVVLASKGYPGAYEKGYAIEGLSEVNAKIYHMGTALQDGRVVTAGGRVLMLVGQGETVSQARERIYAEVGKVRCANLFCRTDIAHWALDK